MEKSNKSTRGRLGWKDEIFKNRVEATKTGRKEEEGLKSVCSGHKRR